MEGSGAGSVMVTYGSGCGPGGPKAYGFYGSESVCVSKSATLFGSFLPSWIWIQLLKINADLDPSCTGTLVSNSEKVSVPKGCVRIRIWCVDSKIGVRRKILGSSTVPFISWLVPILGFVHQIRVLTTFQGAELLAGSESDPERNKRIRIRNFYFESATLVIIEVPSKVPYCAGPESKWICSL